MRRQLSRLTSTKAVALAVAASAGLGAVDLGVVAYAQLPSAAQQAPLAGSISWNSLNQEQRTALRPLATLWPTLDDDHQRKWIALAHNFDRMSPEERATLQGRMTEWAKLTPAQRTQARLNFGEARKLPTDEKKAKWEEYQSLTPEQRQRLAADRPKPPAGTAPALRPVSPEKILRAPLPGAAPQADNAPASSRLNRNTLLPRPPAPAPAPAAASPAPVVIPPPPVAATPPAETAPSAAPVPAASSPVPAASSPVPAASTPVPAASVPVTAQ